LSTTDTVGPYRPLFRRLLLQALDNPFLLFASCRTSEGSDVVNGRVGNKFVPAEDFLLRQKSSRLQKSKFVEAQENSPTSQIEQSRVEMRRLFQPFDNSTGKIFDVKRRRGLLQEIKTDLDLVIVLRVRKVISPRTASDHIGLFRGDPADVDEYRPDVVDVKKMPVVRDFAEILLASSVGARRISTVFFPHDEQTS